MKRLDPKRSSDVQILIGAPTTVQKRLDGIIDRYDIVIHSCNVNNTADRIVIIVERFHRSKTS